MDPTPFQRMYLDAKAVSGIQHLAVFVALCLTYADEARREIGYRVTERPEPAKAAPVEIPHGPAMSARECAEASGWRKGQAVRRGWSPRFFYDHANDLPFTIRPARGRTTRFARTGFLRWLAAQQ